jgi:hypothetical protein
MTWEKPDEIYFDKKVDYGCSKFTVRVARLKMLPGEFFARLDLKDHNIVVKILRRFDPSHSDHFHDRKDYPKGTLSSLLLRVHG